MTDDPEGEYGCPGCGRVYACVCPPDRPTKRLLDVIRNGEEQLRRGEGTALDDLQ